MTGFSSGNMALSRITVATLDDGGYEVNYGAADAYTSADMDASCVCGGIRDPESGSTLEGEEDDPHEEYDGTIEADLDDGTDTGQKRKNRRRRRKKRKGGGSRRRRRLSDDGRAKAMAYGHRILAKNKLLKDKMSPADARRYIGDRIVVVFYEEEGEIHGVHVEDDGSGFNLLAAQARTDGANNS